MMYLLSEEMRKELLTTFKYARDRALKNKDEDSAAYYWGLVDYLQGLPEVTSKPKKIVEDKKEVPKLPIKKTPSTYMSLKEIAKMLKDDHSLTPDEKFELYYEERQRIKGEKEDDGYTLSEILKELNIKPYKS